MKKCIKIGEVFPATSVLGIEVMVCGDRAEPYGSDVWVFDSAHEAEIYAEGVDHGRGDREPTFFTETGWRLAEYRQYVEKHPAIYKACVEATFAKAREAAVELPPREPYKVLSFGCPTYHVDMVATLSEMQATALLVATDEYDDEHNLIVLFHPGWETLEDGGESIDLTKFVYLERHDWTFIYDYPCDKHTIQHELGEPGDRLTVGDFLLRAARDFEMMYATVTAIPRPEPEEGGFRIMNAHYPEKGPDNPYGISMHSIDDLVFEGFVIDVEAGTVTFMIGS